MTKSSSGTTEAEAREVAESARQKQWGGRSVLKEIFLGRLPLDGIHPYPEVECDRPEFQEWLERFETFLKNEVNPEEIDRTGEYPEHVIQGLRELGAFGIKIPKKYGGLGFNQQEYCRALEVLGTYCGNLIALLSAHQSIGLPQPLKMFGTDEQKEKFLPRCAKGAITAFALTEPEVGSDPARLATTATKTPEGDYIIDGEKLWTTNGTLAEIVVVMARDPETKKISCFIVETEMPGVKVALRCHFLGLKAIANGVLHFDKVRVPKENLIGKEGQGLKIALITLNTGRLSLPSACLGSSRACTKIVREWANKREQWGVPIGKHEAIAHKVTGIASTTFAMESLSYLCNALADAEGFDIRLEAAAAKEFNSTRTWRIIDETLQIRGGRGYETAASLHRRGEEPIAVERMLRDSRINLIFEGSSEVMHLFMAREAVDKHLSVAGDLVDPKKGFGAKLAALPKIAFFYAWWYPTRWIGFSFWPLFAGFGPLGKHLRFAHRRARKLARQTFHGMIRFGPKLEKRQGFLFRIVDIGMELFVMVTAILRAHQLVQKGSPHAAQAVELADVFCAGARRRIDGWFHALWRNDDVLGYDVARHILKGDHTYLEAGVLPPATPIVEEQIEQKLPTPSAAE